MKSTALIFAHSPYGENVSEDGLDISLAISLMTNKTGLFFIGDGILLLMKKKNFNNILSFDYTSKFKIFSMYKMNKLYCCSNFFKRYSVITSRSFLTNVIILDKKSFVKKINSFDIILKF